MRLKFLGATGTVTGSKYLLTTPRGQLLVDCGLFQGFKQLRLRNWAEPVFDVGALSAVVLTHAHLDHSGYLPLLVRRGFAGPIYATPATIDLCRVLLPDSGRLQEEEAERANRGGWSRHRPALPLYTEADALAALERFEPMPFGRAFEPLPGVAAELIHAGHILGSAMVRLRAGGRELLFSGDLGRPTDPLMRPPDAIAIPDTLVLESTYGGRRHETASPEDMLGEVIRRTIGRQGVVVVPAFAVGRTQAVLLAIARLKASGAIPASLPVYLNSPMATDATAIYRRHRAEHRLSDAECVAMCHAAHYVTSVEESERLNHRHGPMVIIAGSGMATGGRVVHHLKAFAPDPRNSIVLAGFQAGGTRGAAMLAGADAVKIHGDYVPVRAEVVALGNVSAHADYVEMLDWLRALPQRPRRIYLTHGEPAAADALRVRIAETLGIECTVPDYLEEVTLAPS